MVLWATSTAVVFFLYWNRALGRLPALHIVAMTAKAKSTTQLTTTITIDTSVMPSPRHFGDWSRGVRPEVIAR